jgi:hypothetical protein
MTKECRESISRWTEVQAEDIQLNPVVRLHCKPFIQKFCSVNSLNLFLIKTIITKLFLIILLLIYHT